MKIYSKKLEQARELFKKADPWKQWPRSTLPDAVQSEIIVSLLARSFPEHVAVFRGGRWFAGGYRVRGQIEKVDKDNVHVLLFDPHVEMHARGTIDQGQPSLKSTCCVPLRVTCSKEEEQKKEIDVVIVSDSSLKEDAFIYGLACTLRKASIRLLWIVTKGGAKAAELCEAWKHSPPCDIGLTIFNLNDVMTNGWVCDVELRDSIQNLVSVSKEKCSASSSFFVNSASFYPGLRPDCYPSLVSEVQHLIRREGAEVSDGSKYVSRIKLRDTLHFAVESTETVVSMYSKPIIDAALGHVQDMEVDSQDMEVDTRALEIELETKESRCDSGSDVDWGKPASQVSSESEADDIKNNASQNLLDKNRQASARFHARQKKRKEDLAVVKSFLDECFKLGGKQATRDHAIAKVPFPTRIPIELPIGDDRFAKKASRRFVCDSCGNIGTFSSMKKGNGVRNQCEFAGAYQKNDWATIPGELQQRAYEEKLINANWFCSENCGSKTAGGLKQKRMQRNEDYKSKGGKKGRPAYDWRG